MKSCGASLIGWRERLMVTGTRRRKLVEEARFKKKKEKKKKARLKKREGWSF
jgi:hypothetical protein